MAEGAAGSQYAEVLALAYDWATRTDLAVKSEYKKLGIGFDNKLFPTIKSRVLELAAGKVGIEMSFLTYGRFVDMGAGPGSQNKGMASLSEIVRRVENPRSNRLVLTGTEGPQRKVRKPKKFYSRMFYARLNALLGVVSGSMVETAVRLVKQELASVAERIQ